MNLLLCGTLVPCADYNMQRREGKKWDPHRTMVFSVFSLCNGLGWYVSYFMLFPKWFPRAVPFANASWAEKVKDVAGQKDLIGQIFVDVFLYTPVVFYPMLYTVQEVMHRLQQQSQEWQFDSLLQAIQARYFSKIFVDNAFMWTVWVPGDTLCFCVPVWLRLPTTHFVNFGFSSALSYLQGNRKRAHAGADEI